MNKPFTYRPNYVAAWPDRESEDRLYALGIRRRVHLTTFFDGFGQLGSVTPFPWVGVQAARIAAVVEGQVGAERHLIAELVMSDDTPCAWSHAINEHYRAQGVREDLPHSPRLTLDKHIEPGTAAKFQALVGMVVFFDRHGGPEDSLSNFLDAPLVAASIDPSHSPGEVRLSHITDLANVPAEHIPEFLETMPTLIAMLKIAQNECRQTGAVLQEIMPAVRFVPNKTATFTLRVNNEEDVYASADVLAAANRLTQANPT